jgi:hypothetical protein
MKTASLKELKATLTDLEPEQLTEICLRLAKFKKENKELLTYLLYEAHDESAYVSLVKEHLEDEFKNLPTGNTYYIKKTLRKILRIANRQIKYSGVRETEIELRIFFCLKMRQARIPLQQGTVLYNLFQQQLKKIHGLLEKLPEDVQTDFEKDLKSLSPGPR